jgi:molybdopterin-containing oxidoreductase family iron-sulfur binding subunit
MSEHAHSHSGGEPELVQIGPSTGRPRAWRSLEERAQSEDFLAYLRQEFPEQAELWTDPATRRHFLHLMGASLTLAGVSGCAFQPEEKIVPYVRSPEEVVPGKPVFFTSAAPFGGFGTGILVESHMGRPIKVEGNPTHHASLGATDIFAQAETLALYDPDRTQVVLHNGRISTWDDFVNALIPARAAQLAKQGAGLRVLTESVTSPTLGHQLERLFKLFPQAKWHKFDPVGRDNARAGAKLAFGEGVESDYHLERADVIVSLDADFLTWGPGRLKDARAFAARRETVDGPGMNRLYQAEPSPTVTGTMADHRLPVASRRIPAIAHGLARGLGVAGAKPVTLSGDVASWVEAAVNDLKQHRGSSVVIAGETQPPQVHALAHAMNHALGNVGQTVSYLESLDVGPPGGASSLRDLASATAAGEVELLIILGGNPVYAAPADIDLADDLEKKVPFSVHLSLHEDETSVRCEWHIPEAHFLETWGDVRAFDGTATIQQPLIAPLYGGKSAQELIEVLLTGSARLGRQIVQDYWRSSTPEGDFDAWWRRSLRDGVVAGTAAKSREVSLKPLADLPAPPAEEAELEIAFRPDPTIWDGRYANNGWLQELPKPLTRLTWGNAALVSPATAKRLGLQVHIGRHAVADVVSLVYKERTLRIPVWIQPGQADDSVTVHLGYGRTGAGRVGNGLGAKAYALRTSDGPWSGSGLRLIRTGETHDLAVVQHHQLMENRDLARTGTLAEFKDDRTFAQRPDEHVTRDLTLYDDPPPQARRELQDVGNAWAMAINLNKCIGCNACVVACQAENNTPVVGRDEVLMSREMHWLRIDHYYEGDPANPSVLKQPVPCMHCEKAPCELVCPVGATTHSAEGLNEMTYNRCVGTRYCSNNCPYKVRRFNFLQYTDLTTPSIKMLYNPDVTVRTRGVMEKCTYCVQRLNNARIESEMRGETRVAGNAVQTACAAACPTQAIVFGNLKDPEANVVKARENPRHYALLAELNTRPRTTYLAKLTNPNPDLKGSA